MDTSWAQTQMIVETCKHCGLQIIGDGRPGHWSHAEGPQVHLIRCALEPYGFDAAPVSEECSFACLGSQLGSAQ